MTEVTEDDRRRAERLWNSDVTVAVPRIARVLAELGAELERWKDTAQKAANEALSRPTNTDNPVTVTEDDRRRAIRIAEKYVGAYEGLSSLTSAIALALAETRERAEDVSKAAITALQIANDRKVEGCLERDRRIDDLEAELGQWRRGLLVNETETTKKLADLQAKLEASRDCSGRYHKRIAKLEDENARLRKRLAIFQRNAGLATTEATS